MRSDWWLYGFEQKGSGIEHDAGARVQKREVAAHVREFSHRTLDGPLIAVLQDGGQSCEQRRDIARHSARVASCRLSHVMKRAVAERMQDARCHNKEEGAQAAKRGRIF